MPDNPTIEIFINGNRKLVQEDFTVYHLLVSLDLQVERMAVELNGEILPRQQWPEKLFNPGDRIEIVHFVGGG